MSTFFYHPFGENAPNAKPFTRAGHGCGKLDINGNHTPFYAMCDGVIVGQGEYTPELGQAVGDWYCTQLCENSALGQSFYIRYLHGEYVVEAGDYVHAGDLLGYTTNNNNPDYPDHLHVDFIWGKDGWNSSNEDGRSGPVSGTFNEDKTVFTVKGKDYKIKPNLINWDKLEEWRTNDGSSEYGYCWLIFAQTPQYKTIERKRTADQLKVTIDDYINKMLVGLVAQENSWDNAAAGQAVLTVCRNWIYIDCNNKLGKTNLSFTIEDINEKNELAQHFACFITGEVDWALLDRYYNNFSNYFDTIVPGTNITCLEFVKKFMSEGQHWSYIDEAINNGTVQLGSTCTSQDTEDGVLFPQASAENERLMLVPPFGDWILKWGTQGGEGDLLKPSEILFANQDTSNIVTIGKELIVAHYHNSSNYPSGEYYSNDRTNSYFKTTINNKQVYSPRDCSGFVNGVWEALGDLDLSLYWLTTYNYREQHPSNWELISLNGLSYSDLRPGDVIFREGATKGHGDGHTELIVNINGSTIQTYGLGSDSAMIASATATNYLAGDITDYDYVLRRK